MEEVIYLMKRSLLLNKLTLDGIRWESFRLGDLFEIENCKCSKVSGMGKGNVPYVGATNNNNGVIKFIEYRHALMSKGNCIVFICDGEGSIGLSIYKREDFIGTTTVKIGRNININKYTGTFITTVADKVCGKYNFGYKRNEKNLKREKLMLPVNSLGNPNWQFMEDYMKQQEEKLLKLLKDKLKKKIVLNSEEIKPLSECDWKEFFIEDTTEILSGKDIYEKERECGDTPYITSTANNNGIGYFVNNINLTLEENCISVNRNGSVGYAFYHPYTALYSNDTRKLRPKINDPYFSIFLSNMITLQKDKYGYGYKMGTARLKRQKIMLPVNSNNQPDFEYMSNYMKNIESEKIKAYFRKKKLSI